MYFNSNKKTRLSGANQNSWLSTYKKYKINVLVS